MIQNDVSGIPSSGPTLNGDAAQSSPATVVTDLLIIGAGPAGGALACFLASHGM